MSFLFAFLVGGCYRYVPVQIANVGQREEVRVQVTEAAATRLVKEFGAYTTELKGQVAREREDSVSVSILIGREYGGVVLESARQTLFLGPAEVVDVRRRQLARKRTALVSAGTLVVFGVLVGGIVQWGDPNPPSDELPPPPPPGIRIPLSVRIPFR